MKLEIADTVVALVDLVGYSGIALPLEELLGPKSLFEFNSAIQAMIDQGLAAAAATRADHVVMTTGDGALLTFPSADQALHFAAGLQAASQVHNRTLSQDRSKLIFRLGMAKGSLAVDTDTNSNAGLAGAAIIRAARLEARADPGGALIDEAAWTAASPALRAAYAGPEPVEGKHGEVFQAWRAALNPDAAGTMAKAGPAPANDMLITEVDTLAQKIDRSILVDRLILRLAMPVQQEPPATLAIEDRTTKIMRWAQINDRLPALRDALVALLGQTAA